MSTLLALLMAAALAVQQPAGAGGPPERNVIRHATLGPSYSCRSKEEFARGYEGTALWLSEGSRSRNTPDLLFDGACGGQNFFVVAAAGGDDLGLIADLGPGVPLTQVSAERAFNDAGVVGPDHETRFTQTALVVPGHTYVVVVNRPDARGLYALTVTKLDPDRKVDFNYAVLIYDAK